MAGPTRARSNIDSFVGVVARGVGLAAPAEFPVAGEFTEAVEFTEVLVGAGEQIGKRLGRNVL